MKAELKLLYQILKNQINKNSLSPHLLPPLETIEYCFIKHQFVFVLNDNGTYELKNLFARFIVEHEEIITDQRAIPEELLHIALSTLKIKSKDVEHAIFKVEEEVSILQLILKKPLAELTANELDFYRHLILLFEKKNDAKFAITSKIGKLNSNEDIKKFVQKSQRKLLGYLLLVADNLTLDEKCSIFEYSVQYSKTDILKLLFQTADELLFFIEHKYLEFIDHEVPLSYSSNLYFVSKFQMMKEKLQEKVNSGILSEEVDKYVLMILKGMGETHLNNLYNLQTILFQQAFLTKFSSLGLPDINDRSIVQILVSINFNSKEFIRYLCKKYQDRLIECHSPLECLEQLYLWQKEVKLFQDVPEFIYNNSAPSIKPMLLQFLDEEISIQEKKLSLARYFNYAEPVNSKLKTRITSKQVVIFFKVLQNIGIIESSSKQEIFRFASANFTSIKKENLSISKIKNAYYNQDLKDLEKVKEITLSMFKHLQIMIKNFKTNSN